jgi:tetratricopeptide (TPR) repeat protein
MAMFLGAWFLVTLAPAMAAFCLAYAEESVHDRYLYLPSFALALLAGAAFTRLCSHGSPLRMSLACGLAGAMLAGLAVCTHRQMRYWESNYALFQRATEIAPQNERAAMNFVAELMKRKEYGRALGLCQAMIKLNPESERPVGSAALVSFLIHDYAGAEKYYVQASRLDPSQGNLFYFLGLTRLRLGDYKGAANALRTAVDLSSRAPFFHYTLGVALAQLQEWPEAREQFSQEVGIQTPASFELAQQALRDADRHLREKTRILKQAEPANLDLPGVPN